MSFDNVEVGQQAEGNSAPVGITSFDEVSDVVHKVEAAAKAEKTEANKEVAKVAEKVAEKVAKKLGEEEEKSAETKEEETSQEESTIKAKPIKAFDGDKEIELNPEMLIEYKVDGKLEKMTLADLRNEISGKTNWDRKNNDFHKTKKSFEDQVKFVNEQVDNILKLAQEKPEAALFELARLAGKSPEEYSKMLAGTMEGATRWSDMSQEQQRAAMIEAENAGFKADAERRRKIDESNKLEMQRTESLNVLANELKLTEDDFKILSEDLLRHAQIANPTSEHIYTAWLFKNTAEAFQSVAPQAIKENPSLFNEAAQVLLQNGIRNKEDIESIIKQAYGDDDSARKVGRKVASQAPKTASAATGQKKAEVVSFDDI